MYKRVRRSLVIVSSTGSLPPPKRNTVVSHYDGGILTEKLIERQQKSTSPRSYSSSVVSTSSDSAQDSLSSSSSQSTQFWEDESAEEAVRSTEMPQEEPQDIADNRPSPTHIGLAKEFSEALLDLDEVTYGIFAFDNAFDQSMLIPPGWTPFPIDFMDGYQAILRCTGHNVYFAFRKFRTDVPAALIATVFERKCYSDEIHSHSWTEFGARDEFVIEDTIESTTVRDRQRVLLTTRMMMKLRYRARIINVFDGPRRKDKLSAYAVTPRVRFMAERYDMHSPVAVYSFGELNDGAFMCGRIPIRSESMMLHFGIDPINHVIEPNGVDLNPLLKRRLFGLFAPIELKH